ncbi:MAG: LacI family DNA-binding transcriptional regulator [Micromonosporaceae bacterium]|nr:LacI family DNA-binding transcriptional regulator [Micromonosporaceae bacterium]
MNQDQPGAVGVAPVTLDDVATHAGVSRQTVSNVLNAPHRVREGTRERVEAAIARLGYQPNRAARALRAQASRMIGYRIEPVHEESLASIHDRFLHALADAGREADHHLLLFTADDPAGELAACARLFRTGGVDGFVLYGIDHGDARPAALLKVGAPFAVFGRTDSDSGHCWADVDNVAGVADAVDHLIERGHRRVGFVGWPEGSGVGDRRAEGWRAALEEHGLLADCQRLDAQTHDTIAAGAAAGAKLLDLSDPPTAIVTVTDTLAVGVMRAAQGRGRVIGEDLAVVGFDDTPTARVLGLSSVRQPIEEVGRVIVEMLLARLPGVPHQPQTAAGPEGRLLRPSLVARGSSAAPYPSSST